MGSRSSEKDKAVRPLRWAPYPEPPESGRTPYGRRNPELGNLSPLERTRFYVESKAWEQIARPRLKALDEQRDPRGRQPEWSAEEKEIIIIYGRMCGIAATSVEKIRRCLLGDRQAREAFGFTRPRQGRRGQAIGIDDFLPKQGTLRSHLRKLGDAEREQMLEDVERALRDQYLEIPEVREELRLLHMDGFPIRTRYTAPIYPGKSRRERRVHAPRRRPVNEKRITAPDAGFMWSQKNLGKVGGHGWKTVPITTNDGVCVARTTGQIQDEQTLAGQVLDQFNEQVAPKLCPDKIHVLSADGLFNSRGVRAKCRAAGIAENIHHASHTKQDVSKQRADALKRERIPLVHPSNPTYDNWFATGHRELVCSCGEGRVEKPAKRHNGSIVLAVVGRCKNCGTVRIQSGRWRLAKNPKRFVLCLPGEYADADLSLGNGLTWSDARSRVYGFDRFGLQEGFFGTLRSLGLERKTWFRRRSQVAQDLALVNGALIAAAIEKHWRSSLQPPGCQQSQAAA